MIIKQPNGLAVRTDLSFLAEHLQNELDNQVHVETGPVIEDFQNKLENEEFEDNCVILLQNHAAFESYAAFTADEHILQRGKLWVPQLHELTVLQSYADVYIEDDLNYRIWDY